MNGNYIREESTEFMAEKEKKTKYESVEKVKELLDEQNLGRLQKSLSATEGKLSEILKKLTAL